MFIIGIICLSIIFAIYYSWANNYNKTLVTTIPALIPATTANMQGWINASQALFNIYGYLINLYYGTTTFNMYATQIDITPITSGVVNFDPGEIQGDSYYYGYILGECLTKFQQALIAFASITAYDYNTLINVYHPFNIIFMELQLLYNPIVCQFYTEITGILQNYNYLPYSKQLTFSPMINSKYHDLVTGASACNTYITTVITYQNIII